MKRIKLNNVKQFSEIPLIFFTSTLLLHLSESGIKIPRPSFFLIPEIGARGQVPKMHR
jgi:hypothetical protein